MGGVKPRAEYKVRVPTSGGFVDAAGWRAGALRVCTRVHRPVRSEIVGKQDRRDAAPPPVVCGVCVRGGRQRRSSTTAYCGINIGSAPPRLSPWARGPDANQRLRYVAGAMSEVNMEQRRNEEARKREIPEKTRRSTASSGTISTCGNPVARPGIEPAGEAAHETARRRLSLQLVKTLRATLRMRAETVKLGVCSATYW
ncbi:hypothetical protein PR048_028222 [Dryococelus australis]|uniref:Uncharacterized protein n=1 Tax=Dryococelus australis TaxID=614101 RepID=A0ABQ9GIN1_9NEOP|nr:hypothetical protein PR048_028222 [Dryococelus australis]